MSLTRLRNSVNPIGNDPSSLSQRGAQWAAWSVIALALLLRIICLGEKPPHFDEGVNGWFVDQMRIQGFYHYDPGNYHGPFHFYVLFLAQTLFGRDVAAFRFPLALINVASVWLIFQFRRFIPWKVCFWAALAFAVSPGMVFYSRYAIHEAWMLFGMMLGTWGAAELWTRGSARGLWAAAMGATLMILTKETYIIHFATFALAFGTLRLLEIWIPSASDLPAKPVEQAWNWSTLGRVVFVSALAIVFFYSGGFLDPSSLKGLYQTFAAWIQTGVGEASGHEKDHLYWLMLIEQYELPVAAGLLFSIFALIPGMNRLIRFLAIYGCGTLVAYSLVPYKTPWCIISLIWPFFFLFGSLAYTIGKGIKEPLLRIGFYTGIGALVLFSTITSIRLNFLHPTDAREKYVYVQTLDDLYKLTTPLKQLAALDPRSYQMPIHILLSSYHPLPWVLGDYTAVGYYEKERALPPNADAGVIIVEDERVALLESLLRRSYFTAPFQLRDGMSGGKIYLDSERFAPVFPGRHPEFIPQTTHMPPAEEPPPLRRRKAPPKETPE